jgi:hypothetical protein
MVDQNICLKHFICFKLIIPVLFGIGGFRTTILYFVYSLLKGFCKSMHIPFYKLKNSLYF